MSTTRYKISNIKQLIDLNGKAVNFHLGFKAKSVNDDVFDALVVTQEMLDSNEPLNYQRAEGEISGNITNDNGVYNNYFLCLKSDKPIDIDVGIKINEIPQQAPPQPQLQQQPQQQQPEQSFEKKKYQRYPIQKQQPPPPTLEDYQDEEEVIVASTKKPKKSDYTWVYIFVGVFLVCLLAGFGYYYYTKTVVAPSPPVTADLILKNVEDGFNNLGLKLNEVSSKVTDGLSDNIGKMEHNLTENLHELSERITNPPPAVVPVTSDINNIKESIENIKSHLYTQQLKHVAPETSGDSMAIVNPNEILSRIKSLPKS